MLRIRPDPSLTDKANLKSSSGERAGRGMKPNVEEGHGEKRVKTGGGKMTTPSLSKAHKGSKKIVIPGSSGLTGRGPWTTSEIKAAKIARWITIWGAGQHTKKTLWAIMRKELPPDMFEHILKIELVTQKCDKRVRVDVLVSKHQAKECLKILKGRASLPHWHMRMHKAFSDRRRHIQEGVLRESSWTKVVSMNVDGINNKRESLYYWADEDGVDVLCIQEHKRDALDWKVRLPGFQCFSAGADKSKIGCHGVAVLVRQGIPAFEKVVSDYLVLVEVLIGATKVLIGSVYLPQKPGQPQKDALKTIAAAVAKELRAGRHVMLLGDFNIARGKVQGKVNSAKIDMELLDVEGDPATWKRCPTKRRTAIDHIFVSKDMKNYCDPAKVLQDWEFSDHFPIKVDVAIPHVQGGATMKAPRRIDVSQVIKKGAVTDALQNNRYAVLLQGLPQDPDEDQMDELATGFATETLKVADELLDVPPDKTACRHEFVSKKARRAMKRRSKLHKKMMKALEKSKDDPTSETKETDAASAKARYEQAVTTAAELMKSERDKNFQGYVGELIEAADRNQGRRMFHWINKTVNGKRGVASSPLRNEHGELTMDATDISDQWARHFSKLAAAPTGPRASKAYWERLIPRATDMDELPGLNDDVTWKELQECLLSMARNKAPGESGVPVEWLLMAVEDKAARNATVPSSHLGKIILMLVKGMFTRGHIPKGLNTSLLVPIPKKGDLTDPNNYRGISLMESILKVTCTLVYRRLTVALEEGNRLCKEQAGFRKAEEGMAQVTSLFEVCERRRAKNLPTYLMFVDFAKAYDTVPHAGVLRKLEHVGVRGRMLSFIEELLATSSFKVRTPGALSKEVPLLRGLPQGNAISCIAFDVFINDIGEASIDDRIDIPDVNEKIGELVYADDLVIFAKDRQALSRRAKQLTEWANKNMMTFGVKKCGVMVHNLPEAQWQNLKVRLGREAVPVVEEYTYLGVVISWKLCLDRVAGARAKASMGALARLRPILRTKSVPVFIRLRILKSMLAPVIYYAGELIGFRESRAKSLQLVMNRGCRLVMGLREDSKGCAPAVLYRQCDVAPVFVSLSALRLRAYLKFPSLRTWAKILSVQKTKIRDTWHAKSSAYMKREAIDIADKPEAEQVAALRALLWKRTEEKASVKKRVSWRAYMGRSMHKTSSFVKRLSYNHSVNRGTPTLAAMRMNAFWTAKKAAYSRLIPPRWKKQCPCCLKKVPETMEHLLLKCKRWSAERKKMTNKINEALKKANAKKIDWNSKTLSTRLTLLLGGAADGCDLAPFWEDGYISNKAVGKPSQERTRRKWAAPLFTYVSEFLACIQIERNKSIWAHYNPAKSQILYETAVMSPEDLDADGAE